jgi:photosynthetic reaction center cytochrome c subunit
MTANRRHTLFVLSGLALAAGLALTGAQAQSGAQSAAPAAHDSAGQNSAAPKLAEEQFKNIKVLKGVPADQIFPAMQFITASLGVECEYCHVRGDRGLDFDKDDKKPKQIARKMIEMMFAINKENFEGHREVTCYSCHRGAAEPIATPIVSDESANAAPRPEHGAEGAKPVLPPADQLLDKYLTAVGGASAVEKISSRVEKGKLTANGKEMSIEVYAKGPDKRISIMHLANGDSITAFDGKQGWLSTNGHPHMMSASENDAARIDADLYFPSHVKTLYTKFTTQPGEKIDGHDTYLVVGRSEGQPPLRLYLDQQSGLLLRLIRYAETPLGRLPTQIDYADYRDANGVKIPYRWTLSRPGNSFTIAIDDVQQNVPVDDAKFAAPPMPPPPPATDKKPGQ